MMEHEDRALMDGISALIRGLRELLHTESTDILSHLTPSSSTESKWYFHYIQMTSTRLSVFLEP